MTRLRRWLPWIAVAVVVIGMLNVVGFLAESTALGGDALNGHVNDGRYYVASHGRDTEVSQTAWMASRTHAIATIMSWPFVMLSAASLALRHALPFMRREVPASRPRRPSKPRAQPDRDVSRE